MDTPKADSAEPLTTGPLEIASETSLVDESGDLTPSTQHSTPVTPHTSSGGPTVLTLQDLIELPGQILPEETRMHLKKAGREAALALYSLWKSVNSSQSSSGGKVRKHIDVE
jgi:hypothetical protein